MRNIFVLSLAAGIILTAGNAALAQSPQPAASISVGGQNFDLSSAINDTSIGFSLPSTSLALAGGSIITVGFDADVDPSITYTFSITNPMPISQTYDFDMIFPVVPTVANSPTRSTLTGSMTAGDDGNVSVTQTGEYMGLARATGVDTMGVDHSLGIDTGPNAANFGSPGDSFLYPQSARTGVSSFIITALDVHLHFILSGNGAAASFNGRVSVTGDPAKLDVVPEPGSLALIGAIGVCASGWKLRRRSRR